MATKSILKNVKITDKKLASTFIKTLSKVERKKYEPVEMTRECREIKGDSIREFFGKSKNVTD